MNRPERAVLQRHINDLAEDLILTDKLLASFLQHKIFEQHMIELIKAEKTESEKAFRMLSMLPKRGPEAFDKFVAVIKRDYPWLAATLINSLNEERTNGGHFSGSEVKSLERDRAISKDNSMIDSDEDVKMRVHTFLHKQFGHSKRITDTDRKYLKTWLSMQIQMERQRTFTVSSESSRSSTSLMRDTEEKCCGTSNDLDLHYTAHRTEIESDHEQLTNLLEQFCNKWDHYNSCNTINSDLEHHFRATHINTQSKHYRVRTVLLEVEVLMDKVKNMEKEIDEKNQELEREQKESEKLFAELYDSGATISRLEQSLKQQRAINKDLAIEKERLSDEIRELQNQVEHLEKQGIEDQERTEMFENLPDVEQSVAVTKQKFKRAALKNKSFRGSTENLSKAVKNPVTNKNSTNPCMAIHGTPVHVKPDIKRKTHMKRKDKKKQETKSMCDTLDLDEENC